MFSLLAVSSYAYINLLIISFHGIVCIYFWAFRKQFEDEIQFNNGNVQEIKQKLCTAINFHCSVKDLFLDTADFYSGIIAVQFSCGIIYTATSIFQFEMVRNPY